MFFCNPNIMPAAEYEKRLSEQRNLASVCNIKLVEAQYDNAAFLKAVKGEKNCEICIEMRLAEAAKAAREAGFDAFTTTLSVSPHKNTALINKILLEQGGIYGVEPLCEDFKKRGGFQRSVELSKQYGLYRQNYCGCIIE